MKRMQKYTVRKSSASRGSPSWSILFLLRLRTLFFGKKSVAVCVNDVGTHESYVVISDDRLGDVTLDDFAVRIVRDIDIGTAVDIDRSAEFFLGVIRACGEDVVFDRDSLSCRHRDAIVVIGIDELITDYSDISAGKSVLGDLNAARQVTETPDSDRTLSHICFKTPKATGVIEETSLDGDVLRNRALAPGRLNREENRSHSVITECAVLDGRVDRLTNDATRTGVLNKHVLEGEITRVCREGVDEDLVRHRIFVGGEIILLDCLPVYVLGGDGEGIDRRIIGIYGAVVVYVEGERAFLFVKRGRSESVGDDHTVVYVTDLVLIGIGDLVGLTSRYVAKVVFV